MLHRKFLALLLATALLVSATLPAIAAPIEDQAEPLSIVSVVISWLSKSFGLDVGSEPGAKLGIFVDPGGLEANSEAEAKLGIAVDPGGLEGSSDLDDDASPTTFSTTSNDEPGNELGSVVDPTG